MLEKLMHIAGKNKNSIPAGIEMWLFQIYTRTEGHSCICMGDLLNAGIVDAERHDLDYLDEVPTPSKEPPLEWWGGSANAKGSQVSESETRLTKLDDKLIIELPKNRAIEVRHASTGIDVLPWGAEIGLTTKVPEDCDVAVLSLTLVRTMPEVEQ